MLYYIWSGDWYVVKRHDTGEVVDMFNSLAALMEACPEIEEM
jgi:hypothetical protein